VTLTAVLVLAAGTYAFRLAGPLLFALVATSTLTKGQGFAGLALPIGVLVGGVAAWRKAPFVVVVVLAAVTTAGLRFAGLS
jgi:hypothetical protein